MAALGGVFAFSASTSTHVFRIILRPASIAVSTCRLHRQDRSSILRRATLFLVLQNRFLKLSASRGMYAPVAARARDGALLPAVDEQCTSGHAHNGRHLVLSATCACPARMCA